jgi:hypothetical protein
MSKGTAKPPFPTPIMINGRGYVWRSALEHYKSQLVRHALGGAPEPAPLSRPEGDALVPLKGASAELGVCRRSVGRRIVESQRAVADGEAA